jgi:hypothetical protein
MSANGISHLSTKQARQIAKLNLAANNRAASATLAGSNLVADDRHSYLTSELPTVYTGNVVTTQSHPSGLIQGRPWVTVSYSAGLYQGIYSGWNTNGANPTFFDNKTATSKGASTSFSVTLTSSQTNIGYQWLGYFLPDYTGTWTFATGVSIDDSLTVWIGSSALSGYTTSNSVLNVSDTTGNGTISLTAGTYYPMRVQYGNNSGPGACDLYWSRNASTPTDVWTGKLFYNPSSIGLSSNAGF